MSDTLHPNVVFVLEDIIVITLVIAKQPTILPTFGFKSIYFILFAANMVRQIL